MSPTPPAPPTDGVAELLGIFPTIPENDAFELAVGRFILLYSKIEMLLVPLLISYAKVDKSIGRAVFYNMRPDAAINVLHKIIAAKKLRGTRITELLSILDQISLITKARNDLVHLGTDHVEKDGVQTQKRFITNEILAYSKKVIRKTPVTTADLEAIYSDLYEISLRLVDHMMKLPKVKIPKTAEDIKGLRDFSFLLVGLFRKSYPPSRLPAWRYKPPALVRRRKKRPARLLARAALPPASRT